jgi:hypothetical protein
MTFCCAGNIPTEFGLCTALHGLGLQDNQLTGEYFLLRLIDWCTRKPLADKRSIKYVTGLIPTELGRCSAMNRLWLQDNNLSGT